MSDTLPRLNAALDGRYTIEGLLGQGGMATVYLAKDAKHDRHVALKILKPELAAIMGAERFLSEIKTTANLQHPHILPLHDSGDADGFLYYVMPNVEGETLRQRIDREKQLSVDEAVRITKAVGGALDYAHRQGVIHRDIKPENVLLHDGQPLVADFGIALAVSQAGGGRLTETGLSLGTPYYMSPEQATADRDPGPQSDVYSLGCMLYEMLVGDPPHTGSSAQAVLAKILTERPRPVTQLRETVPLHVGAAVARALERLPADRFETADAFVKALDDSGFTHATMASAAAGATLAAPAGRRPRRWASLLPWAVAAVATGLLLWHLSEEPEAEPVTRMILTLEAPFEDEDAPRISNGMHMAVHPSGSEIVYRVEMGNSRGQLWRRRFDELTGSPLLGTEGAFNPRFSHDGSLLAYANNAGVSVLPAEGGSPTTLPGLSRGFDWGDDGAVYFVGNGLHRWVPGTDAAETLVEGSSPLILTDVLPGSQAALGADFSGSIVVFDLRTMESSPLGPGQGAEYIGGGYIAFMRADGVLMAQPFDLGSLTTTGPAVTTPDAPGADRGRLFTIGADGTLVYRMTLDDRGSERLGWVDRDGTVEILDWLEPTGFSGLSLSPSGTQLVAGMGDAGAFNSNADADIWFVDLETHGRLRLTHNGHGIRPSWHPTDASVVYMDATAGESRARSIPVDGSTAGEDIVAIPNTPAQALWAPNGTELIVRAAGQGRSLFRFVPGEHEAPVPYLDTPYGEKSPAPSPDGNWLIYSSDESGRDEIYARPYPNGGAVTPISTNGGHSPAWSRDGREVFYVDEESFMWAASVSYDESSLRVESRERLFSVANVRFNVALTTYDVAPDGRFLMVFPEGGDSSDARDRLIVVRNWVQSVTGG